MSAGRRRLSGAEIERIVVMRERGATYRTIGDAIGCSAEAISYHCLKLAVEAPKHGESWDGIKGPEKMSRNGHMVRRFTAAEDETLRQLEANGVNYSEIARRLGRRRSSVVGRLMTLARKDERLGL